MRELALFEQYAISGGTDPHITYSTWDIVFISGLSSGIAFGMIGGFAAQSVIEGVKCLIACTVPTAAMSAVLVGGMMIFSPSQETD